MNTPIIIVFSLEPWDGVWRRNQYVIDGLLRAQPSRRVIFIEPPRDVLHDVLSGRRPGAGLGARSAPGYGGRLILFQPTKLLPRALGPLADALLRRSIARVLRRRRVTSGTLWVNDPAWAASVGTPGWPSLYDMTDDWVEAPRSPREHARLVRNDTLLLGSCSAVVVCSEGLRRSRRGIRPDLHVIPNGVDVGRYRAPLDRPRDAPDGGFAVYAGTLHEDRLDVDLVIETAEALAREGLSCVLLGPNRLSTPHTRVLSETEGVMLLGAREHTSVPAYLQHADALIVPHIVDDFTDSLDPLKLYEYLAVGRPIVSTPVAGFRELDDTNGVEIAARADFAQSVAETVRLARPSCMHPDIPDWSERIANFERVLAEIEGRPVVRPSRPAVQSEPNESTRAGKP